MNPVQIFATLMLCFVTVSLANAQSLTQVKELVVLDATGKTLGPVIGSQGIRYTLPHIPFKVGNATFVLAVFKNKFLDGGMPVDLYFNSAGCNGQIGQTVVDIRDVPPY